MYKERVADGCSLAARIAGWQDMIERAWPAARFGRVKVETSARSIASPCASIRAAWTSASIGVQLYAEGRGRRRPFPDGNGAGKGERPARTVMPISARRPPTGPASDYTPRIIPRFPGASVPLEAGSILWQR